MAMGLDKVGSPSIWNLGGYRKQGRLWGPGPRDFHAAAEEGRGGESMDVSVATSGAGLLDSNYGAYDVHPNTNG